VIEVDTKAPLVRLRTLSDGGEVSGGGRIPIQWEAVTPKKAERNVSIFLSPDGGNTWVAVATEIENSGRLIWDVPSINSSNCILKVTVKDASGATGDAQSAKPFTIDSTRPVSAIGVSSDVLSQAPADLGAVLSPMTGKAEGPGSAQAPKVEKPAGPSEPGATEPVPGEKKEVITGELRTTPSPEEPWRKTEEPFTGVVAPGTTEEDVLKAAYAAYKAGQLAMAKEYFKQAAGMNPKDARPHAALGKIYAREAGFNYTAKKESFEAALYEFDKALQLGGDDADVYNDRGYVLLAAKRYKDAEGSFRKAATIGAKPIYWCNLGISLLRLGRRDEAAWAFGKALEPEPEMKEANFFMGDVSAAAGKWANAKKYYTKAADGYGAESNLGKIALSGVQTAREKLGEVQPEPKTTSIQQNLDKIR